MDKLTGRKAKALQALLTCSTKADAAQKAGIGESTLREYLNDPEFIKEYERQLSTLITEAAQQGKQGLSEALSTLREINSDKDRPASARISAARSLLEYGIRLTEIVDIIRKLDGEPDVL